MPFSAFDDTAMRRALELAARGWGFVEPNPAVGAVVAVGDTIVGEGWHKAFGGPHAEVHALAHAGPHARGATLYVTLEPCCHHGKTPPCTDAILAAGIARVVVAAGDPFAEVAGRGVAALRAAGLTVDMGLCEIEAIRLTAPFRKLVSTGAPWVIAKWATSLDGRFTSPPGQDRWISSPESRAMVHDLRSRVDAIAVGIGTALADDPSLTVRLASDADGGPRRPVRIVLDSSARLPLSSTLVATARDVPVLVAVGPEADAHRIDALEAAGCEVWRGLESGANARLRSLLHELGRRRLTTLLIESGPTLLASLAAGDLIDEVWAFEAPRVVGGPDLSNTAWTDLLSRLHVERVSHPGGDRLVRGTLRSPMTEDSSAASSLTSPDGHEPPCASG